MGPTELASFTQTLIASVVGGLTVVGWSLKRVDEMITRKVEERMRVTTKEMTQATSKQIEDLKEEIFDKMAETREINQRAHESVTNRLDSLLARLVERR